MIASSCPSHRSGVVSIGRLQRIAPEGVLDVGQQQLLMLLLVVRAEQHDACIVFVEIAGRETLRHALMYQVFDLYGAGPPRDWSSDLKTLLASKRAARPAAPTAARVAVSKPSLTVEKYAGTYVDSAYGVVVVAAKNGTLTGRYDTLELGVLTHSDFDTFRSTPIKSLDGATPLVFQLDGAGGVASVRMLGVTFMRMRTP